MIVVPGYGLAVAQALHAVKDLASILEEKGVEVKYAIHPVAGRMPGHMNVFLAEADVEYEAMKEMDDINGEFTRTDVTLVIGANDVTNPAAGYLDAVRRRQEVRRSGIEELKALRVHPQKTPYSEQGGGSFCGVEVLRTSRARRREWCGRATQPGDCPNITVTQPV